MIFSQRSLDAKVIMTDENYINFFPCMTIEKGMFLDSDMVENGETQRLSAASLRESFT